MKCPRCGGSGKYTNIFGDYIRCDFCYGTGEIVYGEDDRIVSVGKQKPMTNEEWFCSMSTEEKVKALLDLREQIRQKMRAELGSENKFHKGDYYREWLKEKHE